MPRRHFRGIVLAFCTVLGATALSSCTPPMPPDVLAVFAENQITCASGEVTVATPEAFSGVMSGVGASLSSECPDETVTEVAASDPANIALLPGTPTAQQVADFTATCTAGSVIVVPVFAYPVGLVYNAPGLEGLYFTPEAVAGVLNGSITSWSDPAIAEANPDYTFADLPDFVLMATDDPQPSVEAMTTWLSQVAPQAWTSGPTTTIQGGQRFGTMAEMLTEMATVPSAISVAPLSLAVVNGLGAASLPATPGESDPAGTDTVFISPDDTQLAKVGAGATAITTDEATKNMTASPAVGGVPVPGTFDLAASKVVLAEGQPLVGWPVLAFAHLLVCDDPANPAALSFAQYALRLVGQGSIEAFGLVPLPEPVRVQTFVPLKVTVNTEEATAPSASPDPSS